MRIELRSSYGGQHELATDAAAPVFEPNGEMYGTLCSDDASPRVIDESAQLARLPAARELEKSL